MGFSDSTIKRYRTDIKMNSIKKVIPKKELQNFFCDLNPCQRGNNELENHIYENVDQDNCFPSEQKLYFW